MSFAFPFFDRWTGFWPLSRGSVFDLLGLAIVTSCLFPFTLNTAVVTAPITQLFFRDVSPDRATRLRLALRANAIGSIGSFAALILGLAILSAAVGDSEMTAYFLLIVVCPLIVPGLCEACVWSHWTTRPVVLRAMAAHFTGRCVFAAVILAARWVRERMTGTWIEQYRREAGLLVHGVGVLCLAVLVLAWMRRPQLVDSSSLKSEEIVA